MSSVVDAARILTECFFWMMLGRLALALISFGRRTIFTDIFEKATLPVTWMVRRVTPRSVGDAHIPWLSLPLLLALMILLAPPPARP